MRIPAFRYYFDLHDVDGSGEIDAEELPFLLQCLGVPMTITRLRLLWSVMDRNGNGSVGCEEFVHWFAQEGWTWRTFPHRKRKQPLLDQEIGRRETQQPQLPQPLPQHPSSQKSTQAPKQEVQAHQDSNRYSEGYDFYGNKLNNSNKNRNRMPSNWVGKSVLFGPSAIAYRSLQWQLAKGGRAAVDAELRLRAKAR